MDVHGEYGDWGGRNGSEEMATARLAKKKVSSVASDCRVHDDQSVKSVSSRRRAKPLLSKSTKDSAYDGDDYSTANEQSAKHQKKSAATSHVAAPKEFICPLTQRVMSDPVIIASGYTFERRAILEWFDEGNMTCPKSHLEIGHTNLCPNVSLKRRIKEWLDVKDSGEVRTKRASKPSLARTTSEFVKLKAKQVMEGDVEDKLDGQVDDYGSEQHFAKPYSSSGKSILKRPSSSAGPERASRTPIEDGSPERETKTVSSSGRVKKNSSQLDRLASDVGQLYIDTGREITGRELSPLSPPPSHQFRQTKTVPTGNRDNRPEAHRNKPVSPLPIRPPRSPKLVRKAAGGHHDSDDVTSSSFRPSRQSVANEEEKAISEERLPGRVGLQDRSSAATSMQARPHTANVASDAFSRRTTSVPSSTLNNMQAPLPSLARADKSPTGGSSSLARPSSAVLYRAGSLAPGSAVEMLREGGVKMTRRERDRLMAEMSAQGMSSERLPALLRPVQLQDSALGVPPSLRSSVLRSQSETGRQGTHCGAAVGARHQSDVLMMREEAHQATARYRQGGGSPSSSTLPPRTGRTVLPSSSSGGGRRGGGRGLEDEEGEEGGMSQMSGDLQSQDGTHRSRPYAGEVRVQGGHGEGGSGRESSGRTVERTGSSEREEQEERKAQGRSKGTKTEVAKGGKKSGRRLTRTSSGPADLALDVAGGSQGVSLLSSQGMRSMRKISTTTHDALDDAASPAGRSPLMPRRSPEPSAYSKSPLHSREGSVSSARSLAAGESGGDIFKAGREFGGQDSGGMGWGVPKSKSMGKMDDAAYHAPAAPGYAASAAASGLASAGTASAAAAAAVVSTPAASPAPAAPRATTPVKGTPLVTLIESLNFGSAADQRNAAQELRSVMKGSAEMKAAVVAAGGVEALVEVLTSLGVSGQGFSETEHEAAEHASACLMNLSLHYTAGPDVVKAGGIPALVGILVRGSNSAKAHAAATLFALAKEEDHKLMVRGAGAIPHLLEVLRNGSLRARKDAALTLFALSTNARCARDIIKARAVPTLLGLCGVPGLEEAAGVAEKDGTAGSGLEEKATAVVSNLVRVLEGSKAVAETEDAVTRFVDLLEEGSSTRVKEDAAAVLLQLAAMGFVTYKELLAEGVLPSLVRISQTSREQSEAKVLLDILRKHAAEKLNRG